MLPLLISLFLLTGQKALARQAEGELLSCHCVATGPGSETVANKAEPMTGKKCPYNCKCRFANSKEDRSFKEYTYDLAVNGQARSFDDWDRGSFICHGQYTYNTVATSSDPQFFRVKFTPFSVNVEGEVKMSVSQRRISNSMVVVDFTYTKKFPELIEVVKKVAK